ncbi:hypothetical protein [Alkalihalophilus marmarensis]|uniref:hypothetical protein n=1 Tax=Alkalihalophilus marmarensis TaxID=521377 RepID=UPI002DBD310C|nr:hypothetical protein [Alkalihalophilus marmarensis]MEC2070537.1 hypothetical protein [Alkalihalophilus marmarensis]
MWFGIMMLFFVFALGFTLGGLLSTPKQPPQLMHVILFSFVFCVLTYLGMLSGMFVTSWVAFGFIEIIIVILTFLFIIASVTNFHPTFGFFGHGRPIVLILLSSLFFVMGFEWGIVELRTFFTVSAAILFFCAICLGLFIQQQIQALLWRYSYIVYLPLIWLLFVTIIKLL